MGSTTQKSSSSLGNSLLICSATLCAVVVFVMAGFLSDNKPISPDGKTWMILAGMGVLDALALGVVLAAGSFDRPEFASAGASTFGLVTVVLAWLFLREKISPAPRELRNGELPWAPLQGVPSNSINPLNPAIIETVSVSAANVIVVLPTRS